MATSQTKHNLIDKSNSNIVLITAAAAFVIVFSLIASKSLLAQDLYNGQLITKKKVALNQLKVNVDQTQKLDASYKAFVGTPTNMLGGNPSGTGPLDGDNAKLILDALPSQYDFPALATSLEKMITSQGLQINSISGSDDEIAQQTNQASATPAPVTIPFELGVGGTYSQVQSFISELEHSIRPIQIQSLDLTGDQNALSASITAQTYYQPGKSLSITTEAVK